MREHALKIWRNPKDYRKVILEAASSITIPEPLEAQFGGPEGAIRYKLLLDKLPNLFSFPFREGEEVVVSQGHAYRHEIPVLNAFGFETQIADETHQESGILFGGENFQMEPVTEGDIATLVMMMGGTHGEPGQYELRNMDIRVRDGAVVFSRTMVSRPTTLIYGRHVTQIDPLQAGWLVLQLGLAMWPNYTGHTNTRFRSAVMACAEFCENVSTGGHADPINKLVKEHRSGTVSMMVSLRGPVLDTVQDEIELFRTRSAVAPAIVGPQGETPISFEGISKLKRNRAVFLGTSSIAKFFKRLLLNKQEQAHLVNPDMSKTCYKGVREQGRRVEYSLFPSLPPCFTGASGALLSLVTQDVMGKVFGHHVNHTIGSTSYGVSKEAAEQVIESLPKVGETIPEVIQPKGTLVPISVDPEFVGGVVTDVTISVPDDFGNCYWTIEFSKFDESGQLKIRSSLKGTITYTSVPVTDKTLDTVGLAITTEDGLPLSGLWVAGSDSSKAFGTGCAQGKFNLAVETLPENVVSSLLPKDSFFEGIPEYDEEHDAQGAYNPLIKALCDKSRQRVAQFHLRVPEHQYLKLRLLYASNMVYVGPETFTVPVGTNVLGYMDTCTFHNDGDKFTVTWATAGIPVVEIVKVETITVAQDQGYSESMLEIATFAYSIGLTATADMLTKGGRKHVDRIVKTLRLMAYSPSAEEAAKTVYTWSAYHSDKNQARLQWVVANPVPLWPDDVNVAMRTKNGSVFAVNKAVLERFASTDAAHVVRTVLSICAMAAQNKWKEAESASTGLYATMSTILQGNGFYKGANRGSTCVGAKRMAVIVPYDGSRNLYINPDGKNARDLARLFGCEPYQLEGRMVLTYRAPMFAATPLKIRLVHWVPGHMFGVVAEVASNDEGDFDGDRIYVIPVKSAEAERELERFSARKMKEVVHKIGVKGSPDHWSVANTWAYKPWATAKEFDQDKLVETMLAAMTHQIVQMPTDANRSDLGMYRAAMGLEDPMMALAMKMFVYEPQLAGYDPDWAQVHASMEDKDEFLKSAENVGITDELKEFWWKCVQDHSISGKIRNFRKASDGYVYIKADSVSDMSVALLSRVFKAMAQGMQRPRDANSLFPNAMKVIVKGGKSHLALGNELQKLANKGMPSAVRAIECLKEIQPLVDLIRSQNDKEAAGSYEDDYE